MESENKNGNWKSFLVILGVIILIWLGVSMSSTNSYPTVVKVEYTGIDTARYALIQADSTVTLNIVTNGFSAFQYSLGLRHKVLHVKVPTSSVKADGEATPILISVAQQINDYRSQLGFSEKVTLQPVTEHLRLLIAERQSKVFYPNLSNVSFSFAPGYSLYGMPKIYPDSVVLYGSALSLSKVERIDAAPTQIANIGNSDTYTVALDKSWRKYPDLRISNSSIQVFIPTQECSEGSVEVPIRYQSPDSSMLVRLYPEKVTVTYWVATKDFDRPQASDFVVEARQLDNGSSSVPLIVTSFPSYVRIKDLSSPRVQVVLIQKQKGQR